jgi:hypothetical protein
MELQADRPKMPMELQVDRPELPMERRQLKVNRRGYKIEKEKLIGSNIEESTLP